MGRTVTLVLVDDEGRLLGALPPFDVAVPYWQEVADVVAAARELHHLDVAVLRLLHADRPAPHGGHVTVLAQTGGAATAALAPVEVDLAPHPHRAPWAQPGGPGASVRWAVEALGRAGVTAAQQRSWNLSAVWRLDVAGEPVAWLKQVPAFFAHESAVLAVLDRVAPGLAPHLIAAGPQGRLLLAHVPGKDCHDAGAGLRAAVVADWLPVQRRLAGQVDALLDAGVPDRRDLLARIVEVATPYLGKIAGLDAVLAALPGRLADVAACRLPDSLVHGDLHPGNVRSDGTSRVIIDWGDAVVAHPGFDILRLTEGLPAPDAAALIAGWAAWWRAAVPGCDPERAAALLVPVARLRAAVQYAEFLARIEPSEHPYHAADVPDRLSAAVTR